MIQQYFIPIFIWFRHGSNNCVRGQIHAQRQLQLQRWLERSVQKVHCQETQLCWLYLLFCTETPLRKRVQGKACVVVANLSIGLKSTDQRIFFTSACLTLEFPCLWTPWRLRVEMATPENISRSSQFCWRCCRIASFIGTCHSARVPHHFFARFSPACHKCNFRERTRPAKCCARSRASRGDGVILLSCSYG